MKKRIFALLLACFLLVGAFAGCTDGNQSSAPQTQTPQTQPQQTTAPSPEGPEPITLNIFAGKHSTHGEWADMLLWKTYEEMTGVHVEWDLVEDTNLKEMRNIRLSSGDLPDVFYRAQVSVSELVTYGEQGGFIALNSMLDQHAPNVTAVFNEQPAVRKSITMPDGNIYSLPYVIDPDFTSMTATLKFWVSEDWLARLNMSKPETTEQFYDYLSAVKAADQDVIPFTSHSSKWLLRGIKGAFGVANRGNEHEYIGQNDDTGELVFSPVTNEWRQMLEYLNKLYTEGLIAQDIFSMDYATYVATGSEGKYASFVATSPMMFGFDTGYVGDVVLEGPNGSKIAGMYAAPTSNAGSFVITKANAYPERTVEWMDYFYGEEGSRLFFMGVEGETYTKNADGSLQYVESITNNPNGLTLDQAVGQFTCWTGGYYPGVISQPYFSGNESSALAVAAAENIKNYKPKEVWTAFTFTADEDSERAALAGDIEKYVGEMTSRFISGDVSFSTWDEYVSTIEKMNLARYMEIINTAYDRYKAS